MYYKIVVFGHTQIMESERQPCEKYYHLSLLLFSFYINVSLE